MIALTNHSPPSASDDTALSSDLRKKGGSVLLLSTVYQSEETGLLQALPLNDRVVPFLHILFPKSTESKVSLTVKQCITPFEELLRRVEPLQSGTGSNQRTFIRKRNRLRISGKKRDLFLS